MPLRWPVPRRLPLAAALLCLLGGCEREPAPEPPRPAAPTWRAVPDELRPGTVLVDVEAGAACRVRLSLVGNDGEVLSFRDRDLLAGEVARVWATLEAGSRSAGAQAVAAEDAAQGRSQAWVLASSMGWDRGLSIGNASLFAARPGRGRVLGPWQVLPPGLPVALEPDRDVDLATAAVVDGGEGIELVGRAEGSRLSAKLDTQAGDRALLVRARLRWVRDQP